MTQLQVRNWWGSLIWSKLPHVQKFITANLICGVTFALRNPACKNHMPAYCWYTTPLSLPLFPNMCSSISLSIRGLRDKVLWRRIACIFDRLHTDPFLTLPLGWFPLTTLQQYTIVSCMLSPARWHATESPVPKRKKSLYDDSLFAAGNYPTIAAYHGKFSKITLYITVRKLFKMIGPGNILVRKCSCTLRFHYEN